MPIPFNIYRLKKTNIKIGQLLVPKWNYFAFKEVFIYSLTIFAIGIFQYSADNFRPILLGIFSDNGVSSVTDFRVIQTITQLIIGFRRYFSFRYFYQHLLKTLRQDNMIILEVSYLQERNMLTVFLSVIVSLIILNSYDILFLYIGRDYTHLYIWLNIWCLTVLIGLHNSPVASMVLATGKTKPLIISSAVAAVVSLSFLCIMVSRLNVGAAVIGFAIYMLIQITFYYTYYTPKVLKIQFI